MGARIGRTEIWFLIWVRSHSCSLQGLLVASLGMRSKQRRAEKQTESCVASLSKAKSTNQPFSFFNPVSEVLI
jgi:hypothetical protein